LLAEYFLQCLNRAKGAGKRLKPDQKEWLKQLEWKGNVRELANLVERSFFLSSGDELDIAGFIKKDELQQEEPTGKRWDENITLAEIEREHIMRVLAAKKGNKKEASKALGISRSRLYNLLKKYNAPPPLNL
jgi:DNA-binding NtrC family response regulator